MRHCKAVSAKRPKTVIDHILKHGFITTQELKDRYGYNHPQRAVRDVKEHGIPIEMLRVEGSDGRKIAAYRFGDPAKARPGQQVGRTVLGRELKSNLVALHGERCAIYLRASLSANCRLTIASPLKCWVTFPARSRIRTTTCC